MDMLINRKVKQCARGFAEPKDGFAALAMTVD
jgi:hypothetical protein